MSDIGDLMYRLGYNTVDRFGRKSSEEDRALLREKDKQKAAIEEQNKARIAQMMLENQAYADRQKAQIAAQQGMAREGQEFDMTRDMLNAAEAANRQQAGFKQQRDMSIDEEIAAGERALMMRDLQQEALLKNPAIAAKGQVAAANIEGSDAEVQRMTNRLKAGLTQGDLDRLSSINLGKDLEAENSITDQLSSMELKPGRDRIEKNKQNILLDPDNQALIADMLVGINLGQGETRFGPKNLYTGAQRGSGLHRLPDGTMANGDYTIQASVKPKVTRAQLEAMAADRAVIKADKPVPTVDKPTNSKPAATPKLYGTRLPAGTKVSDWETTPADGEFNPLSVPRGPYGGINWGIPARRDYGIGNYINLDKNMPDIERRMLKAVGDEIASGVDVKTKKALDSLTRNFLHSRSNALYNATQRR